MLARELLEKSILEALQSCVLLTGDGNGAGLVAGRVGFDLVLELR
jgi:hypothetical protein